MSEKPSIEKLRFWGKIFGLTKNYYIVEVDADTDDGFDLQDSEFIKYQDAFAAQEEEEEEQQQQGVPPEPMGHGINQKLFFVSTGGEQGFVALERDE